MGRVFRGPVVVVSGPELEVLARHLGDAIELAYTVRGSAAPHALLEFAFAVKKAAHSSAGSASPAMSGAVAEPRNSGGVPPAPCSQEPAMTLSVAEAARAAEVSESYVRRMIRGGSVEALRGHRGANLVRMDSLAAWLEARGRKEDDSREAA